MKSAERSTQQHVKTGHLIQTARLQSHRQMLDAQDQVPEVRGGVLRPNDKLLLGYCVSCQAAQISLRSV